MNAQAQELNIAPAGLSRPGLERTMRNHRSARSGRGPGDLPLHRAGGRLEVGFALFDEGFDALLVVRTTHELVQELFALGDG